MKHHLKMKLGGQKVGGGVLIPQVTQVYPTNRNSSLNGTFLDMWDPKQNVSFAFIYKLFIKFKVKWKHYTLGIRQNACY